MESQTVGVKFLQELLNHTQLAVKVSPLDELAYQSLKYDENESQALNRLNQDPLYRFNERAFRLGMQFGCYGKAVIIDICDSQFGKRHCLLEPVNKDAEQELTERLMAIVTYVGIYF